MSMRAEAVYMRMRVYWVSVEDGVWGVFEKEDEYHMYEEEHG